MKNFAFVGMTACAFAALLSSGGCSGDKASEAGPGYWGGGGMGPGLPGGEKYENYGENPFVDVSETPVSTFSVDCDGASYSNMRRWINGNSRPPAVSVRIEEFINYFTFDYPRPTGEHNVSVDTEVAACPWNDEHLLVRIGLQGKDIPLAELPATNYVFLIDVSGSMAATNKLTLLKTGLLTLVDQLEARDKVAIVTYSGNVSVALPSTNCDEKSKISAAISSLNAGGSTAGGAAMKKAYEIAVENYIPGGNNRIIMGTDGDFNVGTSSDEELVALVEAERDKGIFITMLGFGDGNLNDSMMEKVADHGNGNYEYIDNVSQIEKVFVNERAKLYAVAKDCKVQVTFDGSRVNKYRLIGYENRIMSNEDFEDDGKDAGDMGVGQSVTAIYEIVPTDAAIASPYASIGVRYKTPDTDAPLALDVDTATAPSETTSTETNFAAGVAAFGMILKDSEYKGSASGEMVLDLCEDGLAHDPFGYRAEFVSIVTKSEI